MGSNSKSRVVLQFNEMDFRHRRALDILRQRPRSMSELVVNAILHYTSCPEAANEFGRDWVVRIVKDVVRDIAKRLRHRPLMPATVGLNPTIPAMIRYSRG